MQKILFVLTAGALFFTTHSQALRVVHEQVILDKLDDYSICQSKDYSGEWCHDALVRWVEKNPKDAFTAAKMTRKAMNGWGAITFFAKAFNQKKGDCKDEDLKLAMESALNLPATSQPEVLKQAKKIGFELCYSDLKATILAAAKSNAYSFENSCKELTAKKELSAEEMKKCSEAMLSK